MRLQGVWELRHCRRCAIPREAGETEERGGRGRREAVADEFGERERSRCRGAQRADQLAGGGERLQARRRGRRRRPRRRAAAAASRRRGRLRRRARRRASPGRRRRPRGRRWRRSTAAATRCGAARRGPRARRSRTCRPPASASPRGRSDRHRRSPGSCGRQGRRRTRRAPDRCPPTAAGPAPTREASAEAGTEGRARALVHHRRRFGTKVKPGGLRDRLSSSTASRPSGYSGAGEDSPYRRSDPRGRPAGARQPPTPTSSSRCKPANLAKLQLTLSGLDEASYARVNKLAATYPRRSVKYVIEHAKRRTQSTTGSTSISEVGPAPSRASNGPTRTTTRRSGSRRGSRAAPPRSTTASSAATGSCWSAGTRTPPPAPPGSASSTATASTTRPTCTSRW